MATRSEPPLIALVGPTASGKSDIGIALAEQIGAEIISADAVAVYRGLDIGSAKPNAAERARAPFHLLDVAAPDEPFTLADFEAQAARAISDIRARGRIPLIVGGTGLYVRAVTAELTVPHVAPQLEFRQALAEEAESIGSAALHERLRSVDPPSADKILPGDLRRIIRALEVHSFTGQPLSSFHTPEGVQGVPRENTWLFGIRLERSALYGRIERRVDTMIAEGLLEEVRSLRAAGYGAELKSMQSLGYRHFQEFLSGDRSIEQTVSDLKRDTRRFAKRQISWFNADPRVRWIDVGSEPMAKAVAEHIDRSLRESGIHLSFVDGKKE